MSNVFRDISSKYTVCRVGCYEIQCLMAGLAMLCKVEWQRF